MKTLKLKNHYLLRLDKGKEIIASLKEFCGEEKIKLGTISGIGATNRIRIGLFDPAEKKYHEQEFAGNFEITSLAGNITTMNGETYLHLHITVGDKNQHVFGGHLGMAIVSATCEIIITVIAGEVDRYFDEEIGLNLLKI